MTDKPGSPVPNAQIKLTSTATGLTRTFATNPSGNYDAPAIVIGQPPSGTRRARSRAYCRTTKPSRIVSICHAIEVRASPDGPDLHVMRPGVQCERCHGPGGAHIAAAKARKEPAAIRREVLNPGRLGAAAQAQVCGECHRIAGPDADDEPELENPVTVRFAPVGLRASRCFRESKTLACVTCHDPHENARPRTDASYNHRCVACHSTGKSRAHVSAGGDCLACHMKQVSLGPYLRFTDHRIRIN